MAGGGVSFSDTTGYMSKIKVQFCGKVAPAGCTQHIFRLSRVKTCVDQSTQLISRRMQMGTLLCRQMTRVHPDVSFTLLIMLTLCYYYHRATRLNAVKRFCLCSLPERFDIFPVYGGCSEGLDAFRFFFKK